MRNIYLICTVIIQLLVLLPKAYSSCDEALQSINRATLLLKQAVKNKSADVAMGSLFNFVDAESKAKELFLVGKQADRIYFINAKTLQLEFLSTDYFDSIMTEELNRSSLQQLDPVQCQEGLTCTVHAMANGLQILNQAGQVTNKSYSQLINNRPLLMNFLNKFISAEAVENSLKSATTLWERIRTPRQHELRREILKEMNIANFQDASIRQMKVHLAKGLPALVDMRAAQVYQEVHDLELNQTVKRDSIVPASTQDALGYHSVLAIGIIRRGWFSDPLIVVSDSGLGQIEIWPANHLKKAEYRIVLLGE